MTVHDDMSDTEVLSAARDCLSGMPLTAPPDVEAIIAGGRARRRRRLIPGVTGTLAVAAGAALAVTALVPASHQASHQPVVHLAAWTVTEQADGNIAVTIRQLKDPAGLQTTLRADGVPASVTFLPKLNPACKFYPGGVSTRQQIVTPLLKEVFPTPYQKYLAQLPHQAGPIQGQSPAQARSNTIFILLYPPGERSSTIFIVIDRSALPGNAGVQLSASTIGVVSLPRLVYASPKCTGG